MTDRTDTAADRLRRALERKPAASRFDLTRALTEAVLTEVDGLRAEVERLRRDGAMWNHVFENVFCAGSEASAEVARLRTLLGRVHAIMVDCDWQSAAAVAGRGSGALEVEAVKVEALVAAELAARPVSEGGGSP